MPYFVCFTVYLLVQNVHGFLWDWDSILDDLYPGDLYPQGEYYVIPDSPFNFTCVYSDYSTLNSSYMYAALDLRDSGELLSIPTIIVNDSTISGSILLDLPEHRLIDLFCYLNESSEGGKPNKTLESNYVHFGFLPPKVTRAQINAVELILGQDTREFRLSWCDHWRSETRSKIYYQINVFNPAGSYNECRHYGTADQPSDAINDSCSCRWHGDAHVTGAVYYVVINTSNEWGDAQKPPVQPTSDLLIFELKNIVKPGAVQDLTAHRVDPQTLKLTWREPVDMASERELSRMEYNVTFSCFSADCISQSFVTANHSVLINGLDIYTEYKFQVIPRSIYSDYWGDVAVVTAQTNATSACRGPVIPLGFYRADRCMNDTARPCYHITVFFQPPPTTCLHGDLDSYSVWDHGAIAANKSSVQLYNIDVETETQLQFFVYTRDAVDGQVYTSPETVLNIAQLANALPSVSRFVVLTSEQPGVRSMTWAYDDDNVESFSILICVAANTESCLDTPANYTVAGVQRQYNVTLPDPEETRYVYAITANKGTQSSGLTRDWVYTCRHDRKPDKLSVAVDAGEDHIDLRWGDPPRCDTDTQLAHRTWIQVSYLSRKDNETREVLLDGWDDAYTINELESSTVYDITVTAGNDFAGAGESTTLSVETDSEPGALTTWQIIAIVIAAVVVTSALAAVGCGVWKWHRRSKSKLDIETTVHGFDNPAKTEEKSSVENGDVSDGFVSAPVTSQRYTPLHNQLSYDTFAPSISPLVKQNGVSWQMPHVPQQQASRDVDPSSVTTQGTDWYIAAVSSAATLTFNKRPTEEEIAVQEAFERQQQQQQEQRALVPTAGQTVDMHGPSDMLAGQTVDMHGPSDMLAGQTVDMHGPIDMAAGQTVDMHGPSDIATGQTVDMHGSEFLQQTGSEESDQDPFTARCDLNSGSTQSSEQVLSDKQEINDNTEQVEVDNDTGQVVVELPGHGHGDDDSQASGYCGGDGHDNSQDDGYLGGYGDGPAVPDIDDYLGPKSTRASNTTTHPPTHGALMSLTSRDSGHGDVPAVLDVPYLIGNTQADDNYEVGNPGIDNRPLVSSEFGQCDDVLSDVDDYIISPKSKHTSNAANHLPTAGAFPSLTSQGSGASDPRSDIDPYIEGFAKRQTSSESSDSAYSDDVTHPFMDGTQTVSFDPRGFVAHGTNDPLSLQDKQVLEMSTFGIDIATN